MEVDPGGAPSELPIFELPLAIVPGELVPLHIFEERYKRMFEFCLEREAPLGVLLRSEDSQGRRVGCSARVTRVLERFDDGRLDVIVTGETPFVVLERTSHPDYPAARVMALADDEDGAVDTSEEAETVQERFAALVERISGEPPDPDDFDDSSAYGLAARIELPAATKQRLLELRSEAERLRVLADALGGLLEAVERSDDVAERAKMNGKVVVG
ncbi:peptidase S16 [Thermoleophilia bacterium SCSIO 60948]|nr:peptidase S16 [Thermoleophilia bacterium SCSIO 60948]